MKIFLFKTKFGQKDYGKNMVKKKNFLQQYFCLKKFAPKIFNPKTFWLKRGYVMKKIIFEKSKYLWLGKKGGVLGWLGS